MSSAFLPRPLLLVLPAVALALAACGSAAESQSVGARAEASHTPPTRSSGPTQTPPPVLDDDGENPDAQTTRPDPDQLHAAEQAAVAFIVAFGQPGRGQQAWWAGIQGLLTPASVDAYASTDVANVPELRVRPGAAATSASTPWLAEVNVPTTSGPWVVTLVRADGRWMVERARPA